MNREEVTAHLKSIVEETMLVEIESPDEDLVAGAKIDSFTMLLVLTFIDEEYGVTLDMHSLDFDAFTSLHTIADLVIKNRAR